LDCFPCEEDCGCYLEWISGQQDFMLRVTEEEKSEVVAIWQNLKPLLAPPPDPPKRKIGFDYKGDGK